MTKSSQALKIHVRTNRVNTYIDGIVGLSKLLYFIPMDSGKSWSKIKGKFQRKKSAKSISSSYKQAIDHDKVLAIKSYCPIK